MKQAKTKYKLQSLISGDIFEDTGWMLDPPDTDKACFVRTVYEEKQLHLHGAE